jgi:hypothetical protein
LILLFTAQPKAPALVLAGASGWAVNDPVNIPPALGLDFCTMENKKAPKSGFRFTISFSFVKPLVSRIPRRFRECES